MGLIKMNEEVESFSKLLDLCIKLTEPYAKIENMFQEEKNMEGALCSLMDIKQKIEDVKEKLRANSFITDEKLKLFITQKVADGIYYFKIDGQESNEYDCCANKDCLEEQLENLKEEYPDSEIEYIYSDNDSDHDRVEICTICDSFLNDTMTWVYDEMDYISENKPYTVEFIKDNAFVINAILTSQPSNDCEVGNYTLNQGGEELENAYQRQLDFFNEVLELSNFILTNL